MKIKKIKIEYAIKDGFVSTNSDGVHHSKTLPYLSVVQAVEGNYDISLKNSKTYNTEKGGFFIAPQDVIQTITHHHNPETRRMICRWVFLKIKFNDLYIFDKYYDLPTILPTEYINEMNKIFNDLFSTDDAFDEQICYLKIAKLLFKIAKINENGSNNCVENAIDFIKDNYHKKIDVKSIANSVNMSESNLYSVFKKHTAFSPISYLNNYRLSAATEQLINTDKSISEISKSVGIDDSVYFNKLFRKAYNMSPKKYKELFNLKSKIIV